MTTHRRLELTIDGFQAAVDDSAAGWGLIYETLRRLCVDHPKHISIDEVSAKLWIIGRTYATQIERKVESKGTQGSSLSTIADHMLLHGKEIDRCIETIPPKTERLSAELMPNIFHVHGELVRLLAPVTRRNQSLRSFVSKYLHFHRPAIPIYDSVAKGNLQALVKWTADLDPFGAKPGEDDEYRWFVLRLRRLNEQAKALGLDPTVRELDWYLVTI
jgi:hypothetical protein